MLYTIYQITHNGSGKCYIGKHQTENPNDGYMGSGQLIRRALKKHGVEAFDKKVLHVFETEEEMNAKEAELVTNEFCLREDTYNICPGGQGGWGYVNGLERSGDWISPRNYDRSKKHNQALSSSMLSRYQDGWVNPFKGKSHSAETIRKIVSVHKNQKRSAEAKSKMSSSASGSKNSQFGTCWINDGATVKKISLSDLDQYPGWMRGRKVYAAVVQDRIP